MIVLVAYMVAHLAMSSYIVFLPIEITPLYKYNYTLCSSE
jgi:hypothetical protein